MIITIDGPAGSGKSTVARKLAARLEIAYLDTGAMYRAIAYIAVTRGIDLTNSNDVLSVARSTQLEIDCGPTHTRVRVEGHDVSEAIRSIAVSAATSTVATCQAVRDIMVERQREIGRSLGSFVSEGRDQGSVVFPDADAKFVLEASLDKRAGRRFQELDLDGEDVDRKAVRSNLERRDEIDAKQWEPLLKSGVAVVIDTTEMTIHEVIEQMVAVLDPQ